MKYFSGLKMSFILAASLVLVANTGFIKRAQGAIVSAPNIGAVQGKYKKVADIQFADSQFARCIKEMGREYVKDLFAIHCNGWGISDVSGIEQLKALRIAHLQRNQLTSIDLWGNKHLIALYASQNQLTSVNVSKNSKLRRLLINNNLLAKIDVRNNPLLQILNLSNNELTALNIYRNRALTQLSVSNNRLSSLKLHRAPKLKVLRVKKNEINELDFSNNSLLQHVSVMDNDLSILKLPKSKNLTVLRAIYNPLSVINVARNTKLRELSFNQGTKCHGKKCKIATYERPRLSDIDFKDSHLNYCIDESYPDAKYVDQITELDCSSRGITDTTGLQQLTDLRSLNLRNNMIVKLDTSKITMLEDLELLKNQIKQLDVSKNSYLSRLVVGSNLLEELDVSNSTMLEQLLANNNKLGSLSLENNLMLNTLFLRDNPLSSIDISNNASLSRINLAPNTVCYGDICPTYLAKGSAGDNGKISPEQRYITHGHVAQFVISPDVGYSIERLTSIGCEGALSGRVFTTTQIAGYCLVYVKFKPTNVSSINFADSNLRDCIVAQHGEAAIVEDIENISCVAKGIESVEGLEYFTNLTHLMLNANQITAIDVSAMANLKLLALLNNQIDKLDVTNNRLLERLTLGGNNLTVIDTSMNDRLENLFVNNNPISELDVSNNYSLLKLFALGSNLTTLDLSNNLLISDLRIEASVSCSGSSCDKRK